MLRYKKQLDNKILIFLLKINKCIKCKKYKQKTMKIGNFSLHSYSILKQYTKHSCKNNSNAPIKMYVFKLKIKAYHV